MFDHIGTYILEDNFRPVAAATPTIRNFPIPINSPVVKYWNDPSQIPNRSGMEFVQVEDGRIFTRPDHFTPSSPYGWKLVVKKT